MDINNLVFFDKNGESYNFSQNSDGVWEGADYFLPISTALYDVSNIFILESTVGGYRFPTLSPGSKLTFKWKTAQSADNFFLFTVAKEDPHTDSTTYMTRETILEVNYADIDPGGSFDLDLTYPLQINVGFSPTEEIKYDRILEVYYDDTVDVTKVASIYFYGEGESEDERFRIWLANFGIKFNREDALLLKNYDLKEGLPDWKQINQARKEILVNRDQIYPYVGTYKGLINIIDILGYRDVLRVKEYWRDSDSKSAYYQKFAMVDVTDLMTAGSIDQINLVDLNGQIKKGGKFKKTEFLALSYEFSKASDTYDDDGVPIVEFTTEFEVDEIFYKLNRLATKLKTEILPVNVVIKDIIGEFIYFNKFNLRSWSDVTYINSLEINDDYNLVLNYPSTKSQLLLIRDIKTLYHKTNNTSAFPEVSFNTSNVDPYQFNQKYTISEIPALLTAVYDYYTNLKSYEFEYHGQSNPMITGDDFDGKVGCPISIEAYIPDFTLGQLDGSKFKDFLGTHFTIGNIRYRNAYEIEWSIIGPQGYNFSWRGQLEDLVKLPHVLPHTGYYKILSTVYDLQGGQSVSHLNLTVQDEEPIIEVFAKLQDKNSYRFKDLTNLTIGDFDQSPIYLPYANAVQTSESGSQLTTHYLDWNTYSNNFGVGSPQNQAQIYTDGIGFEPISTSLNSAKVQWGTGSHVFGQPSFGDYENATIANLSLNRMIDLSYVPDRINGFIIPLSSMSILTLINFGDWNPNCDYPISAYSDIDDLVSQLNTSSNSHVQEYRYVAVGLDIHAHAQRQDKVLNRILQLTDDTGQTFRIYTFCYPHGVYSPGLVTALNSQLLQIERRLDDDLLFLDAPFDDILIKTGETAVSNTTIIMPTSYPTVIVFELSQAIEFDLTSPVIARSIDDPTEEMIGYCTQPTPTTLSMTVDSSTSGSTFSKWSFKYSLVNGNPYETYAAASDINYWINKKFIEFIDTDTTPDFELSGYIASNYDQNSFNLANLKYGLDGVTLPLHQPVVAAISNIDSKKECIWTLTLNTETVVKIKSNSFFIWRFAYPGDYLLTVQVTDVNNNVYELTKGFNAVDALDQKDYINHIENTLNRRNASM
jgi:hypothetical protein